MKLETIQIWMALSEKAWKDAAQLILDYFKIHQDLNSYAITVKNASESGKEITIYLMSGGLVSWTQDEGFVHDKKWAYLRRGNIVIYV